MALNPNGSLYVTYHSTEYNSVYTNIALRTSTDGGLTWGERRDVTANSTVTSSLPVIAIDSSNNLYVAYYSQEYNATFANIVLRTSVDGGLTWSARSDITTNTISSSQFPVITLNASNNVFIAYLSTELNSWNNIALRGSNLGNYGNRKDVTNMAKYDATTPNIAINTSTGVIGKYPFFKTLFLPLN